MIWRFCNKCSCADLSSIYVWVAVIRELILTTLSFTFQWSLPITISIACMDFMSVGGEKCRFRPDSKLSYKRACKVFFATVIFSILHVWQESMSWQRSTFGCNQKFAIILVSVKLPTLKNFISFIFLLRSRCALFLISCSRWQTGWRSYLL